MMLGHDIRYALRLTTEAQGMPAHLPWTIAGVLIARGMCGVVSADTPGHPDIAGRRDEE